MELSFKTTLPLGNVKIERDGKVFDACILGYSLSGDVIIQDSSKIPSLLRRMSYPNSFYGRRVIELEPSSFNIKGEGHEKDLCVVRT